MSRRIPVSAVRSAIERLDHAQRCIRKGDPQSIHHRLQGHSSDFLLGALWALEWTLSSDIDAGPAGRLTTCEPDPRFSNDRLPDGSLPLR